MKTREEVFWAILMILCIVGGFLFLDYLSKAAEARFIEQCQGIAELTVAQCQALRGLK